MPSKSWACKQAVPHGTRRRLKPPLRASPFSPWRPQKSQSFLKQVKCLAVHPWLTNDPVQPGSQILITQSGNPLIPPEHGNDDAAVIDQQKNFGGNRRLRFIVILL